MSSMRRYVAAAKQTLCLKICQKNFGHRIIIEYLFLLLNASIIALLVQNN